MSRIINAIRNLIETEKIYWKYGYDPCERAYNTRQALPPGNAIREAAQRELEEEYKACFAQENAFTAKYGYKSFGTFEAAATFANELCKAVGVKPIKEVRLCEPGQECAGAYYRGFRYKSIYVRLPVSRIVMIHETSHHIAYMEHFLPPEPHGEVFLEVERRLFDYLLDKK